MPMNSQTISGIHRQPENPACGCLAPLESGCAGSVEWSLCCLPVQPAIFRGYSEIESESELHTELVPVVELM